MSIGAHNMNTLLIIVFTATGAVQSYGFDSMANCNAMMPAIKQLYASMNTPIVAECKPNPDAKGYKSPYKEVIRYQYKESYKVKTHYKF